MGRVKVPTSTVTVVPVVETGSPSFTVYVDPKRRPDGPRFRDFGL